MESSVTSRKQRYVFLRQESPRLVPAARRVVNRLQVPEIGPLRLPDPEFLALEGGRTE